MKPTESELKKLLEDKDFICSSRHGFSLAKLKGKYPVVCPDHIIATSLNMTEEELEVRYQEIVACLRGQMGVESADE